MAKVLYVPRDQIGNPGCLLDSVSGVILVKYPLEDVVGDQGVININQRIALHKPVVFGSPAEFMTLWEWDGSLTVNQVGTFNKKYAQFSPIRPVGSNYWIAGTEGGGSTNTPGFHKFDANGVFQLSKGPITFLSNGVTTFCINDAETIAYYANSLSNNAIKSWDLVGNVAGPDVVTNVGVNYRVHHLWNIIGTSDIAAVIVFSDFSNPTRWMLRRYTPTGTIVYENIFDTDSAILGDDITECGIDPDFTSIWVRWAAPPTYDSFVSSSYRQFRLEDGVPLTPTLNITRDFEGVPCHTCPLIILGSSAPPLPNEFSGIYRLVPGKRQDTLWDQDFNGTTDVKIPNPTGRTGYVG